jgi:hypothetical protein
VKLEPFEGHVRSVSLSITVKKEQEYTHHQVNNSLALAVSSLGYDSLAGPFLLELSGLLEHVALLSSSKQLPNLEAFETNFENAFAQNQQLALGWEPSRTAAGIFLQIKGQRIPPPVPKARLELRLRSALTSWGRHRQLDDDEDEDAFIARQHFEHQQQTLQVCAYHSCIPSTHTARSLTSVRGATPSV